VTNYAYNGGLLTCLFYQELQALKSLKQTVLFFGHLNLSRKKKTNCGDKHDETTHVAKNIDFMNLTFRMLQHTSSDVIFGLN